MAREVRHRSSTLTFFLLSIATITRQFMAFEYDFSVYFTTIWSKRNINCSILKASYTTFPSLWEANSSSSFLCRMHKLCNYVWSAVVCSWKAMPLDPLFMELFIHAMIFTNESYSMADLYINLKILNISIMAENVVGHNKKRSNNHWQQFNPNHVSQTTVCTLSIQVDYPVPLHHIHVPAIIGHYLPSNQWESQTLVTFKMS